MANTSGSSGSGSSSSSSSSNNISNNNWYFTKEQLDNSPSRQCGIEADKELSYRQQAANFIQDMGQKLKVSQLCINTAIVYMHRFYVFHSFTNFPWHSIAAAAIFLGAKVEEQPRKLEHVIRIANHCKNPRDTTFDTTSDRYQAQSQDLVFNENILLQTLGFDVAIDHPHTYVVKCCHLVKASKDLAQTSYFIASNSLHLTTMCLQYKPTVVACFCIHLVCKWSNWEIPLSNEKKQWFSYVDPTVTIELLQQLTGEYLIIYEKCPSRLKERILAIGESGSSLSHGSGHPSSPLEMTDKSYALQEVYHGQKSYRDKTDEVHKPRPPRPPHEAGSSQQHREREYREKKERERLAYHTKQAAAAAVAGVKHMPHPHGHHTSSHPPNADAKAKAHAKAAASASHAAAREGHREALAKEAHAHTKQPLPLPSESKANSETTGDVHNKRGEGARPKPAATGPAFDPKAAPTKHHDPARKSYNSKLETDIKKHLSAAIQEKNAAAAAAPTTASYVHKFPTSTSQKAAKPVLAADTTKSVPPPAVHAPLKSKPPEPPNGLPNAVATAGSNGTAHPPPPTTSNLPMLESRHEPPLATPLKKPSLFSPEKTPPHKKPHKTKTTANVASPIKEDVLSNFFMEPLEPVSPFPSPRSGRHKEIFNVGVAEPELRPVVKRIDQMQGYENIVRDACIGIKTDSKDRNRLLPTAIKQEQSSPPTKEATPLSQPLINGIETNPMLISTLLKEAPPVMSIAPSSVEKEKEHHHKKSKKEKHRHKDKEKSREEKEKRKKHKEKDREKHKHKHKKHEETMETVGTQPIKITIPKDKIQAPDASAPPQPQQPSIGLKIKIPKERLKADVGEGAVVVPSGGLKIKISKEAISNYTAETTMTATPTTQTQTTRKRDRDRSPLTVAPASKMAKVGYNARTSSSSSSKSAYTKPVVQLGDGGTAMHRLAESKYNSRGTAS